MPFEAGSLLSYANAPQNLQMYFSMFVLVVSSNCFDFRWVVQAREMSERSPRVLGNGWGIFRSRFVVPGAIQPPDEPKESVREVSDSRYNPLVIVDAVRLVEKRKLLGLVMLGLISRMRCVAKIILVA